VLFRQMEKLAQVKSILNRGWCGLRRVGADLVEEATADEGVRSAVGGWTGPGLRRGTYVDPEHPKVKADVAEARRAVRQGLVKSAVRPHTSPKAKKAGHVRNKRRA